jgi:uncharacterized cupin superfamily protein
MKFPGTAVVRKAGMVLNRCSSGALRIFRGGEEYIQIIEGIFQFRPS